jgi:hypothetical protein
MKTIAAAFVIVSSIFHAQGASAQQTDCNVIAKDGIVKNINSSWSDYSKLIYLSSLTTMDLKTSSESLAHSGKVAVGPISIGPGTWNKDKQDQLRSDLTKIVNIDQLRSSAASLTIASGDDVVAKVVSDCMLGNGGIYIALRSIGEENAVLELMWTSFPTAQIDPSIQDITVIHGKVIGGGDYTRKGTKLGERLKHSVTIERADPKIDLAVIVNTENAGSAHAYLPPSVLPPPPPPKKLRVAVEASPVVGIASGGTSDGHSPFCQRRTVDSCVTPQHGGALVVGLGAPRITYQSGRVGADITANSPEKFCVQFWAATTACETEVRINGVAAATEEYYEEQ